MLLRQCIHRMSLEQNRVFIESESKTATYEDIFIAWRFLKEEGVADKSSLSPTIVIFCKTRLNGILMSIAAACAGIDFVSLSWDGPSEKIHRVMEQLPYAVVLMDTDNECSIYNKFKEKYHIRLFQLEKIRNRFSKIDANQIIANTKKSLHGRYLVFTSGSTGNPKGVPIEIWKLDALLQSFFSIHTIHRENRWAQFSSPGFDLSILDIFAPLVAGATLVTLDREFERLLPSIVINRLNLTVWHSVPSIFKSYRGKDSDEVPSLRLLLFCGEALSKNVVNTTKKIFPKARIFNHYGPSEAVIFCSAVDVTNWCGTADFMPIGKPIPTCEFELDPIGGNKNVGELIIKSKYICSGYLNQSNPNFEVSYSDPSNPYISYRSGDIIVKEGGDLFFLQRLDRQVKINGIRVELDDINGVFEELFERSCCTIWHDEKPHIFVESDVGLVTDNIRAQAFKKIDRSIQIEFHFLTQMPRLESSKIDRNTLLQFIT